MINSFESLREVYNDLMELAMISKESAQMALEEFKMLDVLEGGSLFKLFTVLKAQFERTVCEKYGFPNQKPGRAPVDEAVILKSRYSEST